MSAASAATTRGDAVRSLYVHTPFCVHKCHYCDFYSIVDTRDRQGVFVERLERELTAIAPAGRGEPLRTIFVGGGTPTLLRVDLWVRLLGHLRRVFNFAGVDAGEAEFTVECNPETATRELFDVLRAGGVNRLSFGAQSFDPRHLKTLERWHDPANVGKAIELARSCGIMRQSLDLIFAIPGQTLEDWVSDLRIGLSLGTEHISCYGLVYEPNTAMTARLRKGEFARCDEELESEMFATTIEMIRGAGLDRYEVSNFAKPGAECRHNLAYWRQEQWLAAGPAASGHVAGHRWKNVPRLDDYLDFDDGGFAPIMDHEPPDAMRAATEKLMTGLRLREGIDACAWLAEVERARPGAGVRAAAAVKEMQGRGLVGMEGGAGAERWVLTDAGFLVADALVVDVLVAVG
jgi:oxygen-independent coproporphyrinogen III oxidase